MYYPACSQGLKALKHSRIAVEFFGWMRLLEKFIRKPWTRIPWRTCASSWSCTNFWKLKRFCCLIPQRCNGSNQYFMEVLHFSHLFGCYAKWHMKRMFPQMGERATKFSLKSISGHITHWSPFIVFCLTTIFTTLLLKNSFI